MLLKRVITAVILIPLVILAILFLPNLGFIWASGLFFLLAAWEWSRLSLLITNKARFGLIIAVILSFFLIYQLPAPIVLWFGVLLWLLLTCCLFKFEIFSEIWLANKPLRSILGVMLIAICWFAINFIRNQDGYLGPLYLIILLIWTWSADTGAYFIGRHFGQQKLAPLISPGKTVEGVIGGVGLTLIVAAIVGLFFPFGLRQYISFMLLGAIISLVTVVGDLFESMVKRQSGVKDSGHILPGHGGILDRIDSLLSAAPFFAAGFWLLDYLK